MAQSCYPCTWEAEAEGLRVQVFPGRLRVVALSEKHTKGQGCSSGVDDLGSMIEALGSTSCTVLNKKKTKTKCIVNFRI